MMYAAEEYENWDYVDDMQYFAGIFTYSYMFLRCGFSYFLVLALIVFTIGNFGLWASLAFLRWCAV